MGSSLRLAAALAALTLGIAGCTPDDPAPATPSASGTSVPASASPAVLAESPAPIFEETDDVITVAVQEPSTLDPMRLQDPGGVMVARQLFEGLTRWDPVEEIVVPAAAESWQVSDGGRTFTFRLRQGMTFHDGTPVTSKDFSFAFDRIAQKRSASDVAYTLEDVEGFSEVNQVGDVRHLAGITTPDPLRLVIRLRSSFYDFPAVLTHPSLVPVPARAVANSDRFLSAPVGNGPFRIAQAWTPGDPVLLKAFLGFYDTPELDGIRFLSYPDAAASWLPFTEAEIDVAEVPAGEIEAAREEYGEDAFRPFLASYSYGLNLRSPQLDDIRVRRAINKAIDRVAIAEDLYRGTLQPPRGILPHGMPGFLENICVGVCDFAPDAARAIVAKVKPKDRRLTLEFSGLQPHPGVARMIKGDLESVGFEVRIQNYPFPAYLKRLRTGRHAMFRLGWIAEFPTPDAYLTPLFDGESPDNHSGLRSSAVDRLIEKARSTRSDAKRVQVYIRAEKAILRSLPIAPIGSFLTHWAVQPRVTGLEFDQMGGFDALDVSLTEG